MNFGIGFQSSQLNRHFHFVSLKLQKTLFILQDLSLLCLTLQDCFSLCKKMLEPSFFSDENFQATLLSIVDLMNFLQVPSTRIISSTAQPIFVTKVEDEKNTRANERTRRSFSSFYAKKFPLFQHKK